MAAIAGERRRRRFVQNLLWFALFSWGTAQGKATYSQRGFQAAKEATLAEASAQEPNTDFSGSQLSFDTPLGTPTVPPEGKCEAPAAPGATGTCAPPVPAASGQLPAPAPPPDAPRTSPPPLFHPTSVDIPLWELAPLARASATPPPNAASAAGHVSRGFDAKDVASGAAVVASVIFTIMAIRWRTGNMAGGGTRGADGAPSCQLSVAPAPSLPRRADGATRQAVEDLLERDLLVAVEALLLLRESREGLPVTDSPSGGPAPEEVEAALTELRECVDAALDTVRRRLLRGEQRRSGCAGATSAASEDAGAIHRGGAPSADTAVRCHSGGSSATGAGDCSLAPPPDALACSSAEGTSGGSSATGAVDCSLAPPPDALACSSAEGTRGRVAPATTLARSMSEGSATSGDACGAESKVTEVREAERMVRTCSAPVSTEEPLSLEEASGAVAVAEWEVEGGRALGGGGGRGRSESALMRMVEAQLVSGLAAPHAAHPQALQMAGLAVRLEDVRLRRESNALAAMQVRTHQEANALAYSANRMRGRTAAAEDRREAAAAAAAAHEALRRACSDDLAAGLAVVLAATLRTLWAAAGASASQVLRTCTDQVEASAAAAAAGGWFADASWRQLAYRWIASHEGAGAALGAVYAGGCAARAAVQVVGGLGVALVAVVALVAAMIRLDVLALHRSAPRTVFLVMAVWGGRVGARAVAAAGGSARVWAALWATWWGLHCLAATCTPLLARLLALQPPGPSASLAPPHGEESGTLMDPTGYRDSGVGGDGELGRAREAQERGQVPAWLRTGALHTLLMVALPVAMGVVPFW